MFSKLVPLAASHKSKPEGKHIGKVPAETPIVVSLVLRCKDQKKLDRTTREVVSGRRKPLTRRQFARQFGPSQKDIKAVLDYAATHALTLTDIANGPRRIQLAGTAAQMSAAFGVELDHYRHSSGLIFRGREGTVMLPEHLLGVVTAVRNLDNRPQGFTHLRILRDAAGKPKGSQDTSFNPPQIAALRNVPTDQSRGKGQCMALVEMGGGFVQADLDTYFQAQGCPYSPKVLAISIDGATNSPSTADSADGEVMSDICVPGSFAYDAEYGVYFGQNTSDGFLNVTAAPVHDAQLKPSVVSVSWGAEKSNFTAQDIQSWNDLGQAAATMGVTILVASGDDGSADGTTDGKAHVDWPSASPWILAIGGTRREGNVDTVWGGIPNNGAGGGGVDTAPVPSYQQGIKNLPVNADTKAQGRVTPDSADVADPETGWNVRVDGQDMVIGGTSLSTPFTGGGLLILNAILGKAVGYVHPALYKAGFSVTVDVTKGTNGAYKARKGFDACSGLGTIDFGKLLAFLQNN